MLEDSILVHQRIHNGTMAWKIVKANFEGARYNRKFKIQGDATIEHAFFDTTKEFSF